MVTEARIREILADDIGACVEGVWWLYQRQTHDERQAAYAKNLNGVGFSKVTAYWGTFIGKEVEKFLSRYKGPADKVPWEKILYAKKAKDKAKWIAEKHAGQLARIANARLAAA